MIVSAASQELGNPHYYLNTRNRWGLDWVLAKIGERGKKVTAVPSYPSYKGPRDLGDAYENLGNNSIFTLTASVPGDNRGENTG